jgi:hypothetical protein
MQIDIMACLQGGGGADENHDNAVRTTCVPGDSYKSQERYR